MSHDIIGHGQTRKFLHALAGGVELPHHAFLFSGPESVGKSLVAGEFSAALLGIGRGHIDSNPDFMHIGPDMTKEGKEKEIPIDVVRGASAFLSRFPTEASRRVLLVEEADRMTDGAQNALLKVFEEPNDTSVLILVTSRPGGVRETLRSRSFPVSFGLVPEAEIREGVQRSFDETARATVEPFFFSLGRPGIVFGALSDPERFVSRRDALRLMLTLRKASASERIALSERLAESVPETLRLLGWWVSGLRAMKYSESDPRQIRATYRLLEDIEETMRLIRTTNANVRLLLDRLFLVAVG